MGIIHMKELYKFDRGKREIIYTMKRKVIDIKKIL